MKPCILLLVACCLFAPALALRFGEQCDATPIYTATWQYDDSCENIYFFCDPATNTCNWKNCTNSDYLQGWDTNVHPFPPRCPSGTYCPDANSNCQPLVNTGGRCELQRDDECAGQNAICLNSTCYIKAAPLGGNCGTDTTMYTSYDAGGYEVQQIIIRDNCTTGTYCVNGVCINSKELGASCEQDRECLSQYCSNTGVCINGPDVFHTIPAWLWGVLGVAVVIFVVLVLIALWFLHRYQSRKEHEKMMKFFGDNEEFAKYAMLEGDDMPLVSQNNADGRSSVVYLTTPDYEQSSNLTLHAGRKSYRNSKFRESTFSFSSPSPRQSGAFTPTRQSGAHSPAGNRTQTPEPF